MASEWLERWETGRIGWHEATGNRGLKRHWTGEGLNVLVPLCGKAHDLAWLAAKGNRVTGVELSPIAVQEFFDEHSLDFDIDETGALPVYEARALPVRIACGDYFSFVERGFDAHYDRGALVALTPDLRRRYASHTAERLLPDATQLVITVEYPEDLADGPPFVVTRDELLSYWPGLESAERYDDSDSMPPKFRDAGVTTLFERVWTS